MNPEYMQSWIKACFKKANEHKDGPMLFSIYEFPLKNLTPEQNAEFEKFMILKANAATQDALIEYFDGHEEIEPETIVAAMKHQEDYYWGCGKVVPEYGPQKEKTQE
jgi:hypothetical protein